MKEEYAVLAAAAKRAILHAEDSHSRKAERSANFTLFSHGSEKKNFVSSFSPGDLQGG